jgi:3-methyladenine DNA glycosylase AlkD
MVSSKIKKALQEKSSKERALSSQRFFKTGKGEYAERDVFIGVTVPEMRSITKKFFDETILADIEVLLDSKIHEERLVGLLLLVEWYRKRNQKGAVALYKKNYDAVNNWDLVDISASYILGDWLLDKERKELFQLVRSKNLWRRRIAIVATHAFIKNQEYEETLTLAEMLLSDTEDLIHKAVGWMLREVGKQDKTLLEHFLKKNYIKIPRTTLRYAIERFLEPQRTKYLKGVY